LINNKSLLLHLVGIILTYLWKMHGHLNMKFVYGNDFSCKAKELMYLLLVHPV